MVPTQSDFSIVQRRTILFLCLITTTTILFLLVRSKTGKDALASRCHRFRNLDQASSFRSPSAPPPPARHGRARAASLAPCRLLASSCSGRSCSGLRRCFRGGDGIGNSAPIISPASPPHNAWRTPSALPQVYRPFPDWAAESALPGPASGICCKNHRHFGFPSTISR
jgi:hypothetical protein